MILKSTFISTHIFWRKIEFFVLEDDLDIDNVQISGRNAN